MENLRSDYIENDDLSHIVTKKELLVLNNMNVEREDYSPLTPMSKLSFDQPLSPININVTT